MSDLYDAILESDQTASSPEDLPRALEAALAKRGLAIVKSGEPPPWMAADERIVREAERDYVAGLLRPHSRLDRAVQAKHRPPVSSPVVESETE